MRNRVHIPLMLAGLAVTGVAGAWAQDNSGNPWRVPPRGAPAASGADDERGFTQGYLRGFEQGYRRGAEQATGGAPTANLGVPAATGSTGRKGGVLSDTPHTGLAPSPQPPATIAPITAPERANDLDSNQRAFAPKPSQWGEYPPLDGGRPTPPPTSSAQRPPMSPHYPYATPQAPQPYYAQPYAQPYTAAPQPYPYGGYGYAAPYAGGPSTLMPGGLGSSPYAPGAFGPTTLGTPFGAPPVPGLPGFGVW